ncbi:MAG: hypothetical protein Q4B40_01785 [Clostridia bacterium]|nr:hypothetical protein [Clostridia bacterium]
MKNGCVWSLILIPILILSCFISVQLDLGTTGAFIIAGVIIVVGYLIIKKIGDNKKAIKEAEEAKIRAIEEHNTALKDFKKEICRSEEIFKKLTLDAKNKKIQAIGEKYFGKDFDLEKINEEILKMDKLEAEKQLAIKKEKELEKIRIEKERLEEIKNKEKEKCNLLTRYADYVGIEKRIKMLLDEWEPIYREATANRTKLDELYANLGSKPKQVQRRAGDWAINGGIAHALAGPIVGVLAAQDTINRNNQIDSQNQFFAEINERKKFLSAQLIPNQEKITLKSEKKLEKYDKEISETESKIVSDISSVDVFKSLEITNQKSTVSKTGTITVTVDAELKEKINIFGDIPTVVDGTLKAKFYQNKTLAGEALLVLPKYGVSTKAKLTGMCLNLPKHDIPYEVQIEPYHLWYMER